MAAYKILWPTEQIGANPAATDGQVFDAVEYSYQHIAEPSDPRLPQLYEPFAL